MKKLNSVILIDNDEIVNYINESLITKSNITENIKVFLNAREALDYIIQNYKEDEKLKTLILLDINMPVLSGWDFLDEFQSLAYKIKNSYYIVILTTSENIEDCKRARTYNILNCYHSKPLTQIKLNEIITLYDSI